MVRNRDDEHKPYTDEELAELQAQVDDNMADAEVGPLLTEVKRLRMQRGIDYTALEAELLENLHGEFSSLHLDFNNHSASYLSAEQAIEEDFLYHADWVSQEEKQLAIDTNRVWCIQWYPNTPIGFHAIVGSTLRSVLEALKNMQLEEARDGSE